MKIQHGTVATIALLFVGAITSLQAQDHYGATAGTGAPCACNSGHGGHAPMLLWEDHCNCCSGCGVNGCQPVLWPIIADGARDLIRSLAPTRKCFGGCNGVCCSTAPVYSYRKRQKCMSDLWSDYQHGGKFRSGMWLWRKRSKGNCSGCTHSCTDYVGDGAHYDDSQSLEMHAPVLAEPPVNTDEGTNPFEDDNVPAIPVAPSDASASNRWKTPARVSFVDLEVNDERHTSTRRLQEPRLVKAPQPNDDATPASRRPLDHESTPPRVIQFPHAKPIKRAPVTKRVSVVKPASIVLPKDVRRPSSGTRTSLLPRRD